MRGARWGWLLLVVPLVVPAPLPTVVTGEAFVPADVPPAAHAFSSGPPAHGPIGDGIRDVRSWLVPRDPPSAPPGREWSYGIWSPIAPPPDVPLEDASRERPPAEPPTTPPGSAPDPGSPPAGDDEPLVPPAPTPAPAPSPSPAEPEPAKPPADGNTTCLLCSLLDVPRRLGIFRG